MVTSTPREIGLCAFWHHGGVPSPLTTVDGQTVEIVHRGVWTHGLGPDFRDAVLLFNERELRTGGIEMHVRTRGWSDHGHQRDPAYNTVVLHVVLRHDGAPTRRADGGLVPITTVDLPAEWLTMDRAAWDWSRVGGEACAPRQASATPGLVRERLWHLGDIRLANRAARIEARLSAMPPAEVLWQEVLDGLGYADNREPMQALAHTLPVTELEPLLRALPEASRLATAQGLLLGGGGFLPLSPSDALLGRLQPADVTAIEAAWRTRGAAWHEATLPPGAWRTVRVRPANHPLPRLLAAAQLLLGSIASGGMLATLLGIVRDDGDPAAALCALSGAPTSGIGRDRAIDMLASVILPFALALGAQTGDETLIEAVGARWTTLAAPAPNRVTRRAQAQVAGSARLGTLGARGAQGLIHLDTTLCQPRRCFECPIAELVLTNQS